MKANDLNMMKLLSLLVVLILSACGMQGDLYLPDEPLVAQPEKRSVAQPEKTTQ